MNHAAGEFLVHSHLGVVVEMNVLNFSFLSIYHLLGLLGAPLYE